MFERFAVMGDPIAHSLSPTIHQLFAEQTGRELIYEKIQIDLCHFEQQVRNFFGQGGKGLNITLPCKQRAFAMSAKQTVRCGQAGAANTLWMQAGDLYADNTDGVGLLRDISRHVELANKKILLLGAGGAARGVIGPLLAIHPQQLTIVNRTPEKMYVLQKDFPAASCCSFTDLAMQLKIDSYDVIINATSASLMGGDLALPLALMATKPFCYDLAYNKMAATGFVEWARNTGCEAFDGLGMLVEQAAEAFFIWHGVMPDTTPILNHLQQKTF